MIRETKGLVAKRREEGCIAEKSPGTAFIDGDWCMDIHPFVGNRETRAMAVDNILHMIGKEHNTDL